MLFTGDFSWEIPYHPLPIRDGALSVEIKVLLSLETISSITGRDCTDATCEYALRRGTAKIPSEQKST